MRATTPLLNRVPSVNENNESDNATAQYLQIHCRLFESPINQQCCQLYSNTSFEQHFNLQRKSVAQKRVLLIGGGLSWETFELICLKIYRPLNFMQNDICHTYQLMNISNTPLFEHLQHLWAYVCNKQACVTLLLTTKAGMLEWEHRKSVAH